MINNEEVGLARSQLPDPNSFKEDYFTVFIHDRRATTKPIDIVIQFKKGMLNDESVWFQINEEMKE